MTSHVPLRAWWPLAAVMGFGACDTAAIRREAGADDAGLRDGATSVLDGDGAPDGGGSRSCMANGVGAWKVTVALGHADCASRPITDCATPPTPESSLMRLAIDMCHLPTLHWVRVDFQASCPASLSVQSMSQAAPEHVACLATALSTLRWRCALEADCALVEWDTLALP